MKGPAIRKSLQFSQSNQNTAFPANSASTTTITMHSPNTYCGKCEIIWDRQLSQKQISDYSEGLLKILNEWL